MPLVYLVEYSPRSLVYSIMIMTVMVFLIRKTTAKTLIILTRTIPTEINKEMFVMTISTEMELKIRAI